MPPELITLAVPSAFPYIFTYLNALSGELGTIVVTFDPGTLTSNS
jgi:hypothetical protein